MAIPKAAIAKLATKAGDAISALSPDQQERAMDLISKATGGRIRTKKDAISYASKTEGGLTVVAMNAARAGLSPDQMFDQGVLGELRAAEANALMNNLRNAYQQSINLVDRDAKFQKQGGLSDEIFEIGMIKVVEQRLGLRTFEDSKAFHIALRIVMEMSEARFNELQTLRASV